MEPTLSDWLALRYGAAEAQRIASRWRANFGLVDGEPALPGERHEEYADVLTLLLEHAAAPGESLRALARWIAFSCIGDNHLWEDLGLPERAALTRLIADAFPGLHARNTQAMRWKKFFYKQLCERAEIFACRAPSCDQCSEYSLCFEAPPAMVPTTSEPATPRLPPRWQESQLEVAHG